MATNAHDGEADDLAAIERALEQLLRLYASRKVHARRSAAAGVMITQQGYLLLRRLQEDGDLPMGELARITQMDPAAAGRQVRQLEEDGLVTRTKGEDDGRVVVVKVTPRGAAVRQRLSTVGEDHMSDVLADWPREDREQLARTPAAVRRRASWRPVPFLARRAGVLMYPSDVGAIDLMIGFPSRDAERHYDNLRAMAKDAESQTMAFPAEYMFKDVPNQLDEGSDPVAETIEAMDRNGVAVGLISLGNESTRSSTRAPPDAVRPQPGGGPERHRRGGAPHPRRARRIWRSRR